MDSRLLPIIPDFTRTSTAQMGLELEMLAYDSKTLAPLGTEGSRLDPTSLMERLAKVGQGKLKTDLTGVVIGVDLRSGNFSLEPGGQVEFASSPQLNLSDIARELKYGLSLLEEAAQGELIFLDHGTNPSADAQLPLLVPKHRYQILNRYFASQPGGRGQHMMRYSATAQPNVDVIGEEAWRDAVDLTLLLTPYVRGLFANSRYFQGKLCPPGSERQRIWAAIDSSRTGIPPASPEAYLEWARQAFVFLVPGLPLEEQPRYGELTYEGWERDGFRGITPGPAEWEGHLATLFPDLRLRKFLEIRMVDAQPFEHALAPMAFWSEALQHEMARKQLREWLSQELASDAPSSWQSLLQVVESGAVDPLARQSLAAYGRWLSVRESQQWPESGRDFVARQATSSPATEIEKHL